MYSDGGHKALMPPITVHLHVLYYLETGTVHVHRTVRLVIPPVRLDGRCAGRVWVCMTIRHHIDQIPVSTRGTRTVRLHDGYASISPVTDQSEHSILISIEQILISIERSAR